MRSNTLTFLWGVLLLVMLVATPNAWGAKQQVTYGFHNNFPPFSYLENGKPAGFEVELLEAALRTSDYQLRLRPMTWESILIELSSGALQVTSGMAPTPQRRKAYLFAETPNIELVTRIFQRTDATIKSFKGLTGARASVKRDSLYQIDLENLGNIQVLLFNSQLQAMQALWNGQVQAFCSADKIGYYYRRTANLTGIAATGAPLRITELHYAVSKNQGPLRDAIDAGLQALRESGQYDRIYRKWFVQELAESEAAKLIALAKEGADRSYIPYTLSPQGAAVLTRSGRYYAAGQVESGLSRLNAGALTVAVQKAVSAGDTDIRAAVVVGPDGHVQVPPANERRLLFQFGRGVLVLTEPDPKEYVVRMITELLPFPQEFSPWGTSY